MINYKSEIIRSGKTIYDDSFCDSSPLYIPNETLEDMLIDGLIGLKLNDIPLRTRSKIVKTEICKILGYPIPISFKKVQPRFPSQNFDVYIQKSMNVQIWNEEIVAKRRYVFICVDQMDIIAGVKVINGERLAEFDKTGKTTTKYQARMRGLMRSTLLSPNDTESISSWYGKVIMPDDPFFGVSPFRVLFSRYGERVFLSEIHPNSAPFKGGLLPISEMFDCLIELENKTIPYLDSIQERNRGAGLHKLVCEALGYNFYEDDGTYPDILNQLIEIKLQTSPTIDLGLHRPDDRTEFFNFCNHRFCSQDIRYVIVDGVLEGDVIRIRYVHVVNGYDFLKHFPLFGGRVQNAKLQIPLPADFFKV